MDAAASILKRVRKQGDKAVVAAAKKFDGSRMTTQTMRVSEAEIQTAKQLVDDDFKRAAGKRISGYIVSAKVCGMIGRCRPQGGLGEWFIPFDRVGAYIPGGAAPLVSTAPMTRLAKVAGVKELVACSPAARDGSLNPYIIYALHLAGATEI